MNEEKLGPSIITIPAQIEKVETRVDKSMKIVVGTALEVDPLEMTLLFDLAQKQGYFAFAEGPIKEDMIEIPDIKKEFPTDKTPSERLRSVIYLYHQQRGGKPEGFNDFYRNQIEKLITTIKEKLE